MNSRATVLKTALAVLAANILVGVGVGCSAESGPAPPLTTIEGTWVNENDTTRGITRVTFHLSGDVVFIEVWGSCLPIDCYWGTQTADTENWGANRELRVVWDQSFAIQTQTITLVSYLRLEVSTFVHFQDNSGRSDFEMIEFFRKQ